jgi:hypothetical protein
MIFELKIWQAFKVVFHPSDLLRRAYFFVLPPLFCSLLLSVFLSAGATFGLVFAVVLVVIILFLYQLYLWSVSFFYAQQISEKNWGDYGLTVSELLVDMPIKLRLLLIRLFWYIPSIIALIALSVDIIRTGSTAIATTQFTTLQTALTSIALLWALFAENIFVKSSEFLYSQSGNIADAFKVLQVFRLISIQARNFLVIAVLAVLPNILLTVLAFPLAFISLVPLLGALVVSFVVGVNTLYRTMFLSNLHGQIWIEMRNYYEGKQRKQ